MTIPVIERIEAKLVPDGDCLLFTGGKDAWGYGLITLGKNRKARAHREVYKHYKGEIPEGHVVRHTCDKPACCFYGHLITGTQAENIADMVERGRASRRPGSQHPNAKLEEQDVRTIRELYEQGGHTFQTLATMYDVSRGLISSIIAKRGWKHV